MNIHQTMFAIDWLQLDIDMAQNAEAVVELLDDMHRGKSYILTSHNNSLVIEYI